MMFTTLIWKPEWQFTSLLWEVQMTPCTLPQQYYWRFVSVVCLLDLLLDAVVCLWDHSVLTLYRYLLFHYSLLLGLLQLCFVVLLINVYVCSSQLITWRSTLHCCISYYYYMKFIVAVALCFVEFIFIFFHFFFFQLVWLPPLFSSYWLGACHSATSMCVVACSDFITSFTRIFLIIASTFNKLVGVAF